MTHAVQDTTPSNRIAVFGLDDAGRPHASRFAGQEAELAVKAATLMGFHVIPLATPDHDELAEALPQGRVFASGKAFTPFCKTALHDQLAALAGLLPADGASEPAQPEGKARQGKAERAKAAAHGKRPKAEPAAPEVAITNTPTDWASIRVGALVFLTHGGRYAPWHEAVVVADKGDDLFELRWRDWPKEPALLRRRDQLGLVPAAGQADD